MATTFSGEGNRRTTDHGQATGKLHMRKKEWIWGSMNTSQNHIKYNWKTTKLKTQFLLVLHLHDMII